LTIPASKTDHFPEGVTLPIGKASTAFVCHVRLLKQLFHSFRLPSSPPFFTLASGLPFSRSYLISKVPEIFPAIGEDPQKLEGHSFRIGRQQPWQFWVPPKTKFRYLVAYQHYLKVNLAKREEQTSGLARLS
jgi:hypothetical protein